MIGHWGITLQVLGMTKTIEPTHVFLQHQESKFFLLHVKVVTNKDFNSMKRKACTSDHDTGEQKNQNNEEPCL